MVKKRRHLDAQCKARVALEAIKGELTMAEICSKYEVHTNQVSRWKKKLLEEIPGIFSRKKEKEAQSAEEREQELYKQIGKLSVELEWMKKKSQELS